MAVPSSIVKEMLKETAVKGGVKTAKSIANEALKQQLQEQFGTGIKKAVQEQIKEAAKAGARTVTTEQAREAAKTTYTYTAQAVEENKSFFKDVVGPFTEKVSEKLKNQEMTRTQAAKNLDEITGAFNESTTKREVASTGASQTMLIPRLDEETMLINELHKALPKIIAEQSPETALEILRTASKDPKRLKNISGIATNLKKQGKISNLWKYGRTITKSVMLLQNLENRLLDAGGNIIEHGVSLAELGAAEAISAAGGKLSKFFPEGVFRDMLNSPGVYSGETARSLQGNWIAMKDYLVTGAKNARPFFTGHKEGIKETIIGKNARKLDYEFNWNREQELSNLFLPTDIKAIYSFAKKHPLKTADKVLKSGFVAPRLVDEIPGGAFREGYMLSDSYRIAMTKAQQVGKADDKEFINGMIDLAIMNDNGEPLPADKLKRYTEAFGANNFQTVLDYISEMASRDAARDTYRVPAETTIGRWISEADQYLYNAPWGIGFIYDLLYPLARVGFRIADRAIQQFPLVALNDVFKTFRVAKEQIIKTGKTNVADLEKAVSRLALGSITYAIFGGLAASGILFGKRPKDKKDAAMMDKLGIKEDSVNVGTVSVPFGRLGSVGYKMGQMVNLYAGIRDAKENYYNPQKPYGILNAEIQILEEFVKTPAYGTAVGDLIEKTNLEDLTEDAIINSFKAYERLFVNTKSAIGLEDSDTIQKIVVNVGKELDDYYMTARPKPGFFGSPMKKGLSITQKEVLLEMNNVGCSVQEPEITNTAKVDGVEITLEPVERMLWQEMMQSFHIKDTPGSRPRLTDLETELTKVISNPLYQLLPTRPYKETAFGFEKEEETKAGKLAEVYNDCKAAALEELLSYKDKDVGEKEKIYAEHAQSLYNRAQETKKFLAEKPVKPVIDVPTLKVE